MTDRYFELLDHIGIEPAATRDPETGKEVENPRAGDLQPLAEHGLLLEVPTMVDGQVQAKRKRVVLKPIKAGSRITKTDDPVVAAAIADMGVYREIDPPKSEQPRKPTSTSKEG